MKLEHVAFFVEDVDKVCDWLEKYFGGKRSEVFANQKTGQYQRMVSFDKGADIEVMYSPNISEKTEQTHPGLGYHHTAIGVGLDENYEAKIKELQENGYKFLTGPRVNSFGSKEGIVIGEGGNLTVQMSPGRDGDTQVELNHIGFFVEDNKAFAKFYCDYLKAEDMGCSPVNPKTGQDNYMVNFDNGVMIELMTCPNMLPEPEDRYHKLGYHHLCIVPNSAEEYDETIARLQKDGFEFLSGPRVNSFGCKEAIFLAPGNMAIQLSCPIE